MDIFEVFHAKIEKDSREVLDKILEVALVSIKGHLEHTRRPTGGHYWSFVKVNHHDFIFIEQRMNVANYNLI